VLARASPATRPGSGDRYPVELGPVVGRIRTLCAGTGGSGSTSPPRALTTAHRVHFADARDLARLPSESVELVVTSPPYPMIEMWDDCFAEQDPEIRRALAAGRAWEAFEAMHALLDLVWSEVRRVLVPGGIACINIGDATRTVDGAFALYPNHVRILSRLVALGLSPLPAILWRKQTNAPNKFMGSGMFPPGAYVTLEHEHVLIVRKGDKRSFGSDADRARRRESAFFWEERNHWFSDVWFDLKGTGQSLLDIESRARSGAYPFELAYRLITMFSIKGDTVLDPFLGTGTTLLAAMAAARSSVGFERDESLKRVIEARAKGIVETAIARIHERLSAHTQFIRARRETHGRFGHPNRHYGFPVVTRQEMDLLLNRLVAVRADGDGGFEAEHAAEPQTEFLDDWSWFFAVEEVEPSRRKPGGAADPRARQLELFEATEEV